MTAPPDFEAMARAIVERQNCDVFECSDDRWCAWCSGLWSVIAVALKDAYSRGAADERERCINEVCQHRPIERHPTGVDNWCCRTAYYMRARGKNTASFPALPIDPSADAMVDGMLRRARGKDGK